MQSKKRWTNAVAVALTLVGLFKVLGTLFHVPYFNHLSYGFKSSPAPRVFFKMDDWEKFPFKSSEGTLFGCEDPGGEIKWIRFNYLFREKYPGPHRLHSALVPTLFRKESTVRKYFCGGGVMAERLGCPSEIKSVLFREMQNDVVTSEAKFKCAD